MAIFWFRLVTMAPSPLITCHKNNPQLSCGSGCRLSGFCNVSVKTLKSIFVSVKQPQKLPHMPSIYRWRHNSTKCAIFFPAILCTKGWYNVRGTNKHFSFSAERTLKLPISSCLNLCQCRDCFPNLFTYQAGFDQHRGLQARISVNPLCCWSSNPVSTVELTGGPWVRWVRFLSLSHLTGLL